jgi:hypothetical protein
MSIAKGCLDFTGLYEAELLTELTLRFWHHPLAANEEFRTVLLDVASEILQNAVNGNACLEELSAENTNFVVALWCAEQITWVDDEDARLASPDERKRWREDVRRSVPSCFVNPNMLD